MACKQLSPDALLWSRFSGWLVKVLDLRRARMCFYKVTNKVEVVKKNYKFAQSSTNHFFPRLENQRNYLHALRRDIGRWAEARPSRAGGQTHACHHDHHERPYICQVPECSPAGHCAAGKYLQKLTVRQKCLGLILKQFTGRANYLL